MIRMYISHKVGIFFPWKKFPPEENHFAGSNFPSQAKRRYWELALLIYSSLRVETFSKGRTCQPYRMIFSDLET